MAKLDMKKGQFAYEVYARRMHLTTTWWELRVEEQEAWAHMAEALTRRTK